MRVGYLTKYPLNDVVVVLVEDVLLVLFLKLLLLLFHHILYWELYLEQLLLLGHLATHVTAV